MKICFNFHPINRAARYFFIVLWLFGFIFLGSCDVNKALALSVDELKKDFRSQINNLEKEINGYRESINSLQLESQSLKRDIALFDAKIKSAELEISRTTLSAEEIKSSLADKNLVLSQVQLKLDREQIILTDYLRVIYELDQWGLVEVILSNDKLSDVFNEFNSLQETQESIKESLVSIKNLKSELEQDKQILQDQQEELNQLMVLQKIQRRSLISQQEEKNNLLIQTKGKESNYQDLLKKAKADTRLIKNNLYLLEGVGVSLSLEIAYQYAKRTFNLTGIRPAFLLAVLKNESSWGEKVGTGNWRLDMHPRDHEAFIQICKSLNLDPDKMPVSRKPSYGWGGAIGPAQFLPSVWLSYRPKIAQLTGHNPPNPWDIGDAFIAAGIKMAQAGAEENEWKAAQIYFAGKYWDNPTYYFYGNQVIELAADIQSQLDLIAE